MTVEEAVQAALARATEFYDSFPQTRAVLYRRVGQLQHQLFAAAAEINPDYFGVCMVGTLTDGAVNVWTLDGTEAGAPPPLERVTRVEVADPGDSALVATQEINVVRLTDADDAALPPRATFRDGVLRQVGADLDGAITVRVHYAKQALPVGPADGDRALELPLGHQELVVVGLTLSLLKQTLAIDAQTKAAAIEVLTAEEKALSEAFGRHVAGVAGEALITRF